MPTTKQQAIDDGNLVKARVVGGYKLDADAVIEIINKHIRKNLGDNVENMSLVYAKNGFFHIALVDKRIVRQKIQDTTWQESLLDGINLRRQALKRVFRVLRGEVF